MDDMPTDKKSNVCTRPGCKQESNIGKLTAYIESLKDQQCKIDRHYDKLSTYIRTIEKEHKINSENHKIVIAKLCNIIKTQSRQIENIIEQYESLMNRTDITEKNYITINDSIRNLTHHDNDEKAIVSNIKQNLEELVKTKIDPLNLWKVKITAIAITIPILFTILMNILAFHEQISKFLKAITS